MTATIRPSLFPLFTGLLLAAAPFAARAQTLTFSVLHVFDTGGDTAAHPVAALVQNPADGSFYGTTARGGSSNNGTVFRLAADGTSTVLYSFNGGRNGGEPVAALVRGTDGTFYGTTQFGGYYDEGIVFQITPAGTLTRLFDFGGDYGAQPVAALLPGTDGTFYGTTQYGGYYDEGTVFQVTTDGTVTILYDFGGDYGAEPLTPLALGADGDFYGTTAYGGYYDGGTAFRLTPAGVLTVLHDFKERDGVHPQGALTLASDGNFYGTTANGGQNDYGTVFRLAPDGTLTTLHAFDGQDGSHPQAALLQAMDANLYGTTFYGGASDHGTVFEVMLAGGFGTVLDFDDPDGTLPAAPLIQAADGALYGTTSRGGGGGLDDGTAYRLDLGTAGIAPTVTLSLPRGSAVNESGGKMPVRFTRDGDLTQPLTVSYQLKGTAVNGTDYQTLAGTLTIPAGKASAKLKIVPIDRGITGGGSLMATVKLAAGGSAYQSGVARKASVSILQDR